VAVGVHPAIAVAIRAVILAPEAADIQVLEAVVIQEADSLAEATLRREVADIPKVAVADLRHIHRADTHEVLRVAVTQPVPRLVREKALVPPPADTVRLAPSADIVLTTPLVVLLLAIHSSEAMQARPEVGNLITLATTTVTRA
jgi:hypothetical protein